MYLSKSMMYWQEQCATASPDKHKKGIKIDAPKRVSNEIQVSSLPLHTPPPPAGVFVSSNAHHHTELTKEGEHASQPIQFMTTQSKENTQT